MHQEDIPRAAPSVVVIYGQESENEALADELALDGFDTRLVSDLASVGEVDLIVFGRASKRGAGLGALRALRGGGLAGSGARVLWVSTSSDTRDTLRAFEAGADDVIRAPFVYAELLARVRALLRRPTGETPPVMRYGALTIHTATRTAIYGSTPVELRRREYALLLYLAREPTRVMPKAELLHQVWGYPSQDTSRTLDSHASRLRCKLATAGAIGLGAFDMGRRLLPFTASELLIPRHQSLPVTRSRRFVVDPRSCRRSASGRRGGARRRRTRAEQAAGLHGRPGA
jgi:DNA-binding response OmpR family regulator